MATSFDGLTVAQVMSRFVACATSVGYCRDSGRQDFGDVIQGDVDKLTSLLRMIDSNWIDSLKGVVQSQADPWVKYFALISIGKVQPTCVIEELEALAHAEAGLSSAAAQMAVFQFRRG